MKKYKVTNKGKALLILYLIGLLGSYFLNPLVFYGLSGLLVILIGIEMLNYLLGAINNNKSKNKEKSYEDQEPLASEGFQRNDERLDVSDDKCLQEETIEDVDEKERIEEVFDSNKDYEKLVNDFESMNKDIQSMENDLEAIGKKATALQKDSIESYYVGKRAKIDSDIAKKQDESINKELQNFEEISLIDSIIERLKEIFSFKRYKKGSLVLHNHFGIGKIIDEEDSLKVSFINDQIEEIIEFEYDKNNKIPELNLFKAPKGEDERQYYYNYRRDVSDELLNTIEKIDLNLPDIKYQWNIFLKSGDAFEKLDFIAISDQVHLFSRETKDKVKTELLEELIDDFELEIKIHEISEYNSINSILLKSKIKGIMPLEIMGAVHERIEENNIKDFNERMQYSSGFINQ